MNLEVNVPRIKRNANPLTSEKLITETDNKSKYRIKERSVIKQTFAQPSEDVTMTHGEWKPNGSSQAEGNADQSQDNQENCFMERPNHVCHLENCTGLERNEKVSLRYSGNQ